MKSYGAIIQMKPLQRYFHTIPFYLLTMILQIEIWIFCPLSTIFGSERVKKKNKYVFQTIDKKSREWVINENINIEEVLSRWGFYLFKTRLQ